MDVDFGGSALGFGMEADEDCLAFRTAESVTLSVSSTSGAGGTMSRVGTVEGRGVLEVSSLTFATDSGGGKEILL